MKTKVAYFLFKLNTHTQNFNKKNVNINITDHCIIDIKIEHECNINN